MQYMVEQGSTHREVLERVRAKYGEAAQVLSHRTVRSGGILGLFAKDSVEITFYVKDDAVRGNVRKQRDMEDEKKLILEKLKQEHALQEVLTEVRSIKEAIAMHSPQGAQAQDHETIAGIDGLLADNDFSAQYREAVRERIRAEFSLEALDDWESVQDAVIEWIGDGIATVRDPGRGKPRILVLVGPTGVGKTTTIAKLAAMNKLGLGGVPRAQDVRMVTIDNYRIGARQQIETYGSIMGIPVSSVETAQDLRDTMAKYRDTELILVDTIGKSPRDAVRLAEMQELLEACGATAEVYLAVAATTKTQDMCDIMRQFEPFGYQGVIVTKMDETGRVGNVLSALAEKRKPLAYVTDGQRVPQDIERANPLKLLLNLEGFRLNRPKLEERYGNIPTHS